MIWTNPTKQKCVVTGCDAKYEWMLKWWLNNYKKHNTIDVVFANFGMSPEARKWCSENGQLVVDITQKQKRNWFKKPIAMLKCPYETVVWIDSDCEIRGNIDVIFEYASKGVAVTLDPYNPWIKTENAVASGVVGASNGNKLIERWAVACSESNSFRGDQEVLNNIIENDRSDIVIMPKELQWLRIDRDNKNAIIMHWTGGVGKQHIRKQIGLPEVSLPRRTISVGPKSPIRIENKRIVPIKVEHKIIGNKISGMKGSILRSINSTKKRP